jgi:putative restriction endonuclease
MTEFDIRIKALLWIKQQTELHGGILPRRLLEVGFPFENNNITLIGAQGIWIPKGFKIPISIATTVDGPYNDITNEDGIVMYKYQGNDPNLRTNRGLRQAMLEKTPLVYFKSIQKSRYFPILPVFIIEDNPETLTFQVDIDPAFTIEGTSESVLENAGKSKNSPEMRRYITIQTRQRLHQTAFREFVLDAYNNQCTLCRLHHPELLDAAHIIPDSEPEGEPVVNNGLALCKIHHSAFDQNIIGISPDYQVKVRKDILEERDGPMLKFGLQQMDGINIILPENKKNYPYKESLARRFEEFKKAV